jgi:hypothetical protein
MSQIAVEDALARGELLVELKLPLNVYTRLGFIWLGPAGPCVPLGPIRPWIPCEPVAPVAPVSPLGP